MHRRVVILRVVLAATIFCPKGNALLCGRTAPLVHRHPSSLTAAGHDDWYIDDDDGDNDHLDLPGDK